ncbi:hypothetical protein [Arcobacter arenosus]|uniref:Helix-turn-helix domain-containing protein n=1 Tax=Arcobacter arenosus TaxID=2576037 RepID=A0A5R8XYA7_9BACT|nr:hypothetical protein [Arcobacter arenosus]TLP36206.1 hypothetical protein FDK22_13125 [Arcobacter arenosus]
MQVLLINPNEFNQLVKKIDNLTFSVSKLVVTQEEKDKKFQKKELTIKEAIQYTGYSDSWFRVRLKDGSLNSRKEGAKIKMINKKELDNLINK